MNFNDIKPEDYSKETFGKCIRARREELGRTVRDVAKAVGMSPIYLSDIERGIRVAPASSKRNYMENLIRELQIQEDELQAFNTMAEATCGRYEDISTYLSKSPSARFALRLAEDCDYPESEWQEFIDRIQAFKASKK